MIPRFIKLPLLSALLVTVAGAGAMACSSPSDETGAGESEVSALGSKRLGEGLRPGVAAKQATCPFIGAAVAMKAAKNAVTNAVEDFALDVFGTAARPVAPITGPRSVEAMGNTGDRSTLGYVLAAFALGNHGKSFPGTTDPVPANMFSLGFPGSQGSHPGHSFILQGDPASVDTGAFSESDYQRLVGKRPTARVCPSADIAHGQGAIDGSGGHAVIVDGKAVVPRAEVGRFIAENVFRDPKAKVLGRNGGGLKLLTDAKELQAQLKTNVLAMGTELRDQAFAQKLTKLLGEDNLVGSAGEFALLFAFLENSPKTVTVNGEPALSVEDLQLMFKGEAVRVGSSTTFQRRLPEGWETWHKSALTWATETTAILTVAALHYRALEYRLAQCD